MEGEISRGAMLGIVLIALAAIIGLGFGIFAIAKGVANEGTANVQDQLTQVSLSLFNEYDQKVVAGTQVMSAYNNLAGKPYTIWISTSAVRKNVAKGNTSGLSGAAQAKYGDTIYLVYNAKIAEDATFTFKNGIFVLDGTFLMDETSGKISYNSVIGNLSKSGQLEYIPSSARFDANLIKDTSGTIMGIAFRQVDIGEDDDDDAGEGVGSVEDGEGDGD